MKPRAMAVDAADAPVTDGEAPDVNTPDENGAPLVVVMSQTGQVLTIGKVPATTDKDVLGRLAAAPPGMLIVEAPPTMAFGDFVHLIDLSVQSGRRQGIVLVSSGKDARQTAPMWLPKGTSAGQLVFPDGTVSQVRGHIAVHADSSRTFEGSIIDASHPLDAALAARPLEKAAVAIDADRNAPFSVVVDTIVSVQKRGAFVTIAVRPDP